MELLGGLRLSQRIDLEVKIHSNNPITLETSSLVMEMALIKDVSRYLETSLL